MATHMKNASTTVPSAKTLSSIVVSAGSMSTVVSGAPVQRVHAQPQPSKNEPTRHHYVVGQQAITSASHHAITAYVAACLAAIDAFDVVRLRHVIVCKVT
jgi:hypothetical protein